MDSFLQTFNQLKIIHCMCPKCDNIMRVSDLRIHSKGTTAKTWLDTFEAVEKRLEKKEEKYEDEEESIRQKAVERGRRQVPKLIKKSINKQFANLKLDPYDIKAILHPIDFVAFNGMNNGNVRNVTLLTNRTKNSHLQKLHKGIAKAVKNKAYDWKVLRVLHDGEVEYY